MSDLAGLTVVAFFQGNISGMRITVGLVHTELTREKSTTDTTMNVTIERLLPVEKAVSAQLLEE